MPVKKTKKSPRSIRYQLYADQKLKKISLKRISARLKKAKQPPRSIRLKNSVKDSVGMANSVHVPSAISSRAIVLGMTCVVAVAALVAARQPATMLNVARADALPEASVALENAPMPARLDTKDIVVSEVPTTTAAEKPSMRITPADKPVEAPVMESIAKSPAVESAAEAAAVGSSAQADVQNVAPVTITGCLELDDETFWLKDTSGAVDVPKSRSWRSGFLKKRSSRIELVAAGNALKLTDHVGERVEATGTLMDREMRARSLRRVAASCK